MTIDFILSRSDVSQQYVTDRKNKYIALRAPLPSLASPTDQFQQIVPIYRITNASPVTAILLRVKVDWGLPVDPAFLAKISNQLYLCHYSIRPTVSDYNSVSHLTFVDPAPLSRVPITYLTPWRASVQRLLLFRYIFGFNMALTNLYCTFLTDTAIIGVYSRQESRPFGLTGKIKSNVASWAEKPSMHFTHKALHKWFYPESPGAVFRRWFNIVPGQEEEVLGHVYQYLAELVVDEPGFYALPAMVYQRMCQLSYQK